VKKSMFASLLERRAVPAKSFGDIAMTVWATIRRLGLALALLASAFVPAAFAADSTAKSTPRAKPTASELRESAEKAEKAGDWEAAFSAYCHLFVADRATPELREKLNASLRRVQQLRRHRDPGFQQFSSGMSIGSGLDLFAEVIQKVPAVFVEREKATPQNLWNYAIEELDRALGNPAFRQAFLDNPRADKLEQFRAALRRDWAKRSVNDHKEARATLRQLIATAQELCSVRIPAALAIECACGACSGLDEYTVFLTPNRTGIELTAGADLSTAGLYLNAAKDGLVVQGIVPNSWFALNYPQIRCGDRVAKINGRPVESMASAAEALRHSNVDGNHTFEFPPTPDRLAVLALVPVTVPTVYGDKLLNAGGIGYARIGSFSPTTPRELDVAINRLKAQGARAVVLDLRGNHGGTFLAGVEVARRLLPAGLIVTTQGQAPEVDNQVFSSASGMSAHDIKLVLLIDAETASAAEVLAAALKDNDRAKLVGMPSFGKGTVQYPLRLVTLDDTDPTSKKSEKTGTVRVTIAKLIAPHGEPINGSGVTPNVLEANEAEQLRVAIDVAIDELEKSMMRTMDPDPEPSPSPMMSD
jgi:carboxyl-terminal processing protease